MGPAPKLLRFHDVLMVRPSCEFVSGLSSSCYHFGTILWFDAPQNRDAHGGY